MGLAIPIGAALFSAAISGNSSIEDKEQVEQEPTTLNLPDEVQGDQKEELARTGWREKVTRLRKREKAVKRYNDGDKDIEKPDVNNSTAPLKIKTRWTP